MQEYKLKDGIIFYAATPETATADFIKIAQERNIEHINIISINGYGKGFVFNGKIKTDEYLAIPKNPVLLPFMIGMDAFQEIFEPARNPDKLPEATAMKLKGKSFYLDAGHGGDDSGAINSKFGLKEKIAALDVCLMLGEKLAANGATVFFSRLDNDTRPSLSKRASAANELNVTAFISIHLNSAENKSAQGIETLVYHLKGKAYDLAGIVQKNMVAATGWTNRGVKARPDLTVLKKTKMPAILCEIGFISNDAQAQKLFMPETQDKIAKAISKGIVAFYSEN